MTTYATITSDKIKELQHIIGEEAVFTALDIRKTYGQDHTENLCFPPEVVLKPSTTSQVQLIMQWAFQHHVPVTPIGGRTGLSGGMLAVHQGIGLSLERMNQVVAIDEENLQATVQPGVITEQLQQAVAERGLFYPVDPSSQGSCFIGGNIAENAGGARAVKYGVTKDYVLSLEVVLPDGSLIHTGAHTLKNATGYNLTQLMIGSEGTLGIVTQAVLKLLPSPQYRVLLWIPFFIMEEAAKAVASIFKAGITPSALEFMERDVLDWAMQYIEIPNLQMEEQTQAVLMVEVDGAHEDVLFNEAQMINEVVEQFQIGAILFASTEEQKAALWRMRRNIAEVVKVHSVYKEEDTVVPRYELPELLKGIKEIGKKYQFKTLCYGHAGDGNLHVNIIKEGMTDEQWTQDVPKGIVELFELTVRLKGTLSGEHGIGWVQKNYMPLAFSAIELQLMKSIKHVFDPMNIMNPGKIFPDS